MASKGVNKVILIGNLGADPEVRYMPSGDAVANINIATSDSWKDKQTGETRESTEWHRVVFFGRLAEVVGQYLRKGSKVYVEGKLRTRKWQGQDGQDRYTTEVVVDINGSMQMLDSRSSGGSADFDSPAPRSAPPQRSAPPSSMPQRSGEDQYPSAQRQNNEDFEDDIPF